MYAIVSMATSNIKDLSNSGQRHVGCFFGDAEKVANDFFTQQNENHGF